MAMVGVVLQLHSLCGCGGCCHTVLYCGQGCCVVTVGVVAPCRVTVTMGVTPHGVAVTIAALQGGVMVVVVALCVVSLYCMVPHLWSPLLQLVVGPQ
jgi:hypothetical protein